MSKFNAAFWRWFGDSKVVDANGEPLVVYHGTSESFDAFVPGGEEGMIFFTSNKEAAEDYGDRVVEAFLRIRRPYKVSPEMWHKGSGPSRAQAEARGYDGFIIEGHDIGGDPTPDTVFSTVGDTYIVFSPTQIKAVGNRGTWDPEDPDIRHNPGWKVALRLPDGEIIASRPNERTHESVYSRLLREGHPNVISMGDPDVEDGFISPKGRFMTRDEASVAVGYHADSAVMGNPKWNPWTWDPRDPDIRHNPGDLPPVVYHGTLPGNATKIRREGIRKTWGTLGPGVYAERTARGAFMWAVSRWCQKHHKQPEQAPPSARVAVVAIDSRRAQNVMGTALFDEAVPPENVLGIRLYPVNTPEWDIPDEL